MTVEIIWIIAKVCLSIAALYFYTKAMVKNGILTRDNQTMSTKLTASKNLSYIVAKELEKHDPYYKTLAFKTSRASTTDDFNNLVHEIYEAMSPIEHPTATSVQTTSRETVLPSKPRPKK